MPLHLLKNEFLGTHADQTYSNEYCFYCLKDGVYTVDYSMQQMIDVWVKYTDKYNNYADTDFSPENLRAELTVRLPHLKRWRQKQETGNIHSEIVNRIQIYINQHLFEELETAKLSELAGVSFYYLRKIFKTVANENLGSYIQRLRLEYIAYQLVSTHTAVTEIISHTHLYNKSSLSKAFRKHFGMSPIQYRTKYTLSTLPDNSAAVYDKDTLPQITRLSPVKVTCLQVKNEEINMKIYANLWKKLREFAEENHLTDKKNRFVSLSLDEPYITHPDRCRYYLGIINNNASQSKGNFTTFTIPGGLHAIFRHKGSHKLLPEVYRYIYLNWLPRSEYQQREPLTFEVYLNSPREVPVELLETEIYIPVRKNTD